MPDILHELQIGAPSAAVYEAVSSAEGLSAWWTLRTEGVPVLGQLYTLDFGPEYIWSARVTSCLAPDHIEWEFINAEPDFTGTRLRIELNESTGKTTATLAHTGWKEANAHFRVSSYCWALYLRLLRLYVEEGTIVPYSERSSA